MSVTTQSRAPTRLARVRHRLSRCSRSRRTASSTVSRAPEVDRGHGPAGLIQTPAGPEAAERALAWLARQARWQSTLSELERP